jgi:site-specific recombinase XerD
MQEKNIKILQGYEFYLEIKNYKKRGIEEKLRDARFFFEYIESNNIELKSYARMDCEKYRENLVTDKNKYGKSRYKIETINGIISNLRLFFKYLIEKNIALKNAFSEIEKMKDTDRLPKNILTIEQIGVLLKNIEVKTKDDFMFKVVFEFLYSTGSRISEVENLMKKDIDLKQKIIIIKDDKERQDRISPLTENAAYLLELYLKKYSDNDYVFKRGANRTLNKFMNNRLKRLCSKIGFADFTCHSIRHTIASQMLKKGADIREVQRFLGHRKIKNTEIYTRLETDDLKKIIDEMHPRERNIV